VAKHLLNNADVGMSQKLGGKGVAEYVGMDRTPDRCSGELFGHPLDARNAEPIALENTGEKEFVRIQAEANGLGTVNI